MESEGSQICGIGGVRRYDRNSPINREELFSLLCSLERRGNHATGIALLNVTEAGDASIEVHKAPQPAWAFTKDKATEGFIEEHLSADTSIALLHTRFATVGNPLQNENNHPIADNKVAIVHNGGISNHTYLFNKEKMDRVCETDSDAIRMLLSKYNFTEKGLLSLSELTGSAAIAAVSVEQPDMLILGRSGSPLSFGFCEDKLWWASEMGAIQKAVRPWLPQFGRETGLWGRKSRADIAYNGMLDNTVYLLGPEGISMRRPFNSCSHYNAPTYSGMHQNYGSRMSTWKRERPKTIVATTEVKALPATAAAATVEIKRYKVGPCPKCGAAQRIESKSKWDKWVCAQKDSTGRKCNTSLTPLDALKDHELTYED